MDRELKKIIKYILSMKILNSKWKMALRVLPLIAVVVLVKLIVHSQGLEFLALSPLFTALVSANIFLIGFLISGVLVDFKESEKIPNEIASSLETISDECYIIHKTKQATEAKECLKPINQLSDKIIMWFCKKERTTNLLDRISGLNDHFASFEPLTQANFIARLKQEQSMIRKLIQRAHTIRETSFNAAGYTIAEFITFVLTAGLVFAKIEPYYESVFFVAFVPFIMIYMIFLIRHLDDPFDYQDSAQGEISLKPLLDIKSHLKKDLKNMNN